MVRGTSLPAMPAITSSGVRCSRMSPRKLSASFPIGRCDSARNGQSAILAGRLRTDSSVVSRVRSWRHTVRAAVETLFVYG